MFVEYCPQCMVVPKSEAEWHESETGLRGSLFLECPCGYVWSVGARIATGYALGVAGDLLAFKGRR